MKAANTDPANLLLIFLGTGELPNCPSLDPKQCELFEKSCQRMFDFLLEAGFARLGAENQPDEGNLMFLFWGRNRQDPKSMSANSICRQIKKWLQEKTKKNKSINSVFVYFVGHGHCDARGNYYLMVYDSDPTEAETSCLSLEGLARSLREGARHLRQYLVIDACMSARASKADWQSSQGVALLCSTSADDKSDAVASETCTRFTGALLDVLEKPLPGKETKGSKLSLREIKGRVEEMLKERWSTKAILPEVHSPKQGESRDIADLPFLPNVFDAEKEAARTRPVDLSGSIAWQGQVRSLEKRTAEVKRQEANWWQTPTTSFVVFLAVCYFLWNVWPTLYAPYRDDDGNIHQDMRVNRLDGNKQKLVGKLWLNEELTEPRLSKDIDKLPSKPAKDGLGLKELPKGGIGAPLTSKD